MTSVADAFADLLVRAGVEVAFGVVSIHNLPLVDALERSPVRFVPTRTEAAAANAADAYARVSGRAGVVVTSTGGGAANAAGPLVEAWIAGSAVLHVTGQIESAWVDGHRGVIHECKDQLGMLAAVGKAAHRVATVDEALPVVARALAQTRSAPFGPVSVEWPIDLQYGEVAPGEDASACSVAPDPPVVPDDDVIARAVALLATATRPVLWVGGGAAKADDHAAVVALAERLGAGVLSSGAGRGVVPESHPLCVGNFGQAPAGRELLAEADLLVSLGTHFRSNETGAYGLVVPAEHVQVDVDPAALGRVYPTSLPIAADVGATVAALLAALGPHRPGAGWSATVARARTRARADLRAEIGWQADLADRLAALVADGALVVRDVTVAANQWANRLVPAEEPAASTYSRGGAIGQGVGMAIGAALARPDRPVVCLVGDGGFACQLGELATIAQEDLAITFVLFNDRGYGVMRTLQDTVFGRRAACDLVAPDFAGVARAFGLDHHLVDRDHPWDDAVDAAVVGGRPSIVEVDLDNAAGPPSSFLPPIGATRVGAA